MWLAVAGRGTSATDRGKAKKLDKNNKESWRRRVAGYLKHHFRPTLFVSACVTILHLSTSWFDPFDSYTFLWMGNFASEVEQDSDKATRIAVVEIDGQTYEKTFGGRSPLDRTQIAALLEEVYAANPKLVVIDLDLSPLAQSLTDPAEKEKDDAVQKLILDSSRKGISTVLLEPFPVEDEDQKKAVMTWRCELECRSAAEKGHVIFGNGDIPERFGMSNWFYFDDNSFHGAARRASGVKEHQEVASVLVARERLMIDPRAYKGRLEIISISDVKTGELTARIRGAEKSSSERVVYFGAAYGGDDLFATPLGRLYGVELHAAAFATCWQNNACAKSHERFHHFAAMFVDLLVALSLGAGIGWCWRRYTRRRSDPDPEISEVAGKTAFAMMVGLIVVTLGLTAFAGLLLGWLGIWISPIPIAFGMFFEAWVLGPIAKHHSVGAHSAAVVADLPNSPAKKLWINRRSLKVMKAVAMWIVVPLAVYLIWR